MYWPLAKETTFKDIIFSSGGYFVQHIKFGRGHHDKLFCEIIMKLDQWFRRRCRLKIFPI